MRNVVLIVVAVASVARAAEVADGGAVSWDEQARLLAGLPVDGGVLGELEQRPAWKKYAKELDQGWAKLEKQRLAKMRQWGSKELTPRINATDPLVYIFGGPDLISVDVLYPDAPLYVLCGLEHPGGVPSLESLPAVELDRGLENLLATLKTTINLSYFVTSAMGPDLKKTQLRGVLPLLLLFLARHGDRVLEVEHIFLDKTGAAQVGEAPANGVPGLRLRFLRGGEGAPRELDYFSMDLTNDALPAKPGLFPYLEGLGEVNAFLKAASFILHDRHFSVTREYLLNHSGSILQDDSGVPFRFLPASKWSLTFFGEYTPNKKVFEDHFQTDMKKAWDAQGAKSLPFATGYPHESGSNLTLALKRVDGGTP